jgi:hypothetical protein
VRRMDTSHHFENSALRERIVEHVFVGDLLRALWKKGVVDIEVLRSEFEASGYLLAQRQDGREQQLIALTVGEC